MVDGQLIHDAGGKKGKISLPLASIHSIEGHKSGNYLCLMGPYAENGKPKELAMIEINKTLNLEALYRIIEMGSTETQGVQ